MKKRRNRRQKGNKVWGMLAFIGVITGMGLSLVTDHGAVDAAEEKALANRSWESVRSVIERKLGEGYNETGMCTGFLYWCLDNAYGVDWGTNSYVVELEDKLIAAGITKVAEGTSGTITKDMKPGDIIIFADSGSRSHCAILGDGGKIYHADYYLGVRCGPTLEEWMALPHENKNCDRYIVYRGLNSTGDLSITKVSSNDSTTKGNDCYSLAGAKYGLYRGDTLAGTMVTDQNGKATLTDIPYGTYTLKEITPSRGYALDVRSYGIVINSAVTTKKLDEIPQSAVVDAVLYKVDKELNEVWTEDNSSQFAATLAGAEYTVQYFDGYFDENADFENMEPVRTWTLVTDERGKIELSDANLVSGDPFYYDSAGQAVFPLGTVVIQEVTPPEGYVRDNTLHVRQITSEGNAETVETYNIPTHGEQIIRGDLELIKVRDSSLKRLANIPFTLTSVSTGQQYTIMTDVNGYASTAAEWNPHIYDTNGGAVDSGIWFGVSDAIDDDKGALPYDTYIMDEQPCDANVGLSLIKGIEIVIYKNNMTVDLGTVTNDMINIETTASVTGREGKTAAADKNVTLVDRVAYDGLVAGNEYTLVGTVYDKSTKKPLEIDGKAVTSTMAFVPEQRSGTTEIRFTVDTSQLGGRDLVIFERLYDGAQLTAIHEDINNGKQTIHVEENKIVKEMKENNNVKTGDSTLKRVIMAVNLMILSAAAACAALLKENG